MTRRHSLALGLAAGAASCGRPEHRGRVKAITGATSIDPGGETLRKSVILISGSRIQQIGVPEYVDVPSDAETWNVADRFVIPAPVELGQGVLLARIDSLAEARAAMIRPPNALEGIVSDAEELPPELVSRLAEIDAIVAPRLAKLEVLPERLARGLRHVKTLVDARIRLASFAGPEALAEWRLLAQAGLTPRQVLESATIHAARAARLQDDTGSLRAGFFANLWVLKKNPLQDVAMMAEVESILHEGEWKRGRGSAK